MNSETQSSTVTRSLLFLIIALFVFFIGLGNTISNAVFVNRAVVTEGTVLEVSYDAGMYDEGEHYDTTVEFVTGEGQLIRFEEGFSETHVGDKVVVLYNPSDPSKARIYGDWQLWIFWIILMAIGSAMFIWGGGWNWLRELKPQIESRLQALIARKG